MEIVAYLLCALLYGALSVYFWRTRWVSVGPHVPQSPLAPAIEHAFVLAPLTLHAVLLAYSLFASDGLHLGLGNAVSAILWLTVFIYWSGNFVYRLEGLQALVLPLASLAVLLQGIMPSAP
ncbi:MAG TPA: inner membrane protein YpjD, partial [Burkholderiales bacterium]|nr:inner membrane protein YpjD [Burkholderiales bacterium]